MKAKDREVENGVFKIETCKPIPRCFRHINIRHLIPKEEVTRARRAIGQPQKSLSRFIRD